MTRNKQHLLWALMARPSLTPEVPFLFPAKSDPGLITVVGRDRGDMSCGEFMYGVVQAPASSLWRDVKLCVFTCLAF